MPDRPTSLLLNIPHQNNDEDCDENFLTPSSDLASTPEFYDAHDIPVTFIFEKEVKSLDDNETNKLGNFENCAEQNLPQSQDSSSVYNDKSRCDAFSVPPLDDGLKHILDENENIYQPNINIGTPSIIAVDHSDTIKTSFNNISNTPNTEHNTLIIPEINIENSTSLKQALKNNSLQNSTLVNVIPKQRSHSCQPVKVQPRPLSAETERFLYLLDLASGKTPKPYSGLKDRVQSLFKNSNKKSYSQSHGPKVSSLGVKNIIKRAEFRDEKANMELKPNKIKIFPQNQINICTQNKTDTMSKNNKCWQKPKQMQVPENKSSADLVKEIRLKRENMNKISLQPPKRPCELKLSSDIANPYNLKPKPTYSSNFLFPKRNSIENAPDDFMLPGKNRSKSNTMIITGSRDFIYSPGENDDFDYSSYPENKDNFDTYCLNNKPNPNSNTENTCKEVCINYVEPSGKIITLKGNTDEHECMPPIVKDEIQTTKIVNYSKFESKIQLTNDISEFSGEPIHTSINNIFHNKNQPKNFDKNCIPQSIMVTEYINENTGDVNTLPNITKKDNFSDKSKFLHENGADINVISQSGMAPLNHDNNESVMCLTKDNKTNKDIRNSDSPKDFLTMPCLTNPNKQTICQKFDDQSNYENNTSRKLIIDTEMNKNTQNDKDTSDVQLKHCITTEIKVLNKEVTDHHATNMSKASDELTIPNDLIQNTVTNNDIKDKISSHHPIISQGQNKLPNSTDPKNKTFVKNTIPKTEEEISNKTQSHNSEKCTKNNIIESSNKKQCKIEVNTGKMTNNTNNSAKLHFNNTVSMENPEYIIGSDVDKELYKAVRKNQLGKVRDCLAHGANPEASINGNGGNILHKAVSMGQLYIVQALLAYGADFDSRTPDLCNSPMHLAAQQGFDEIVYLLYKHGSEVNASNMYGVTPLQHALAFGRMSTINLLLRIGADPLQPNCVGETARAIAIRLGYFDLYTCPKVVKLENNKGTEVQNIPNELPKSVKLIRGIEEHCAITVETCLQEGGDPNTIVPLALYWPAYATVLHRAAHHGNDVAVKLLLNAGANVNAKDVVGNTPLHASAQSGKNKVIKILLENGADINAISQSGMTPLHRAASKGNDLTVNILLKRGADRRIEDAEGRTPSDWARRRNFPALANKLGIRKKESHLLMDSPEGTQPNLDYLKQLYDEALRRQNF